MINLNDISTKLKNEVVDAGICTGCGACVALASKGTARMIRLAEGVFPAFNQNCNLPDLAWEACPGKGIDYPKLYHMHFGSLPNDWRVGHVNSLWTGYASDDMIRRTGASGGVISAVLIYLLELNYIDGAIVAKQGCPSPEEANWFIARTREEILACAQSVYVPVSMLDALPYLQAGERYAISCLPEQSAALRVLQHNGHCQAQQISYVLGPYTGTALETRSIRALLRAKGVKDDERVTSVKWRAGEWPGYLQILTNSGRDIRSKKVYYNFLIPFYVTQTSLQSMDFANEFTDLSVGDAWSPQFEGLGQGFSVVASRSQVMTQIIDNMSKAGLVELKEIDVLEASSMHGHMIDFKKRGGYLRNQWRLRMGKKSPDYGIEPVAIDVSRILAEVVISSIFTLCRTRPARWLMEIIPEWILGPLFNQTRLLWKSASKPVKRKGLRELKMHVRSPRWKEDER